MERIIGDPAVKIVPSAPSRPSAPSIRLGADMYRALATAQQRLYPEAITIPRLVIGSTDMAQLRTKGVQAYWMAPRFD